MLIKALIDKGFEVVQQALSSRMRFKSSMRTREQISPLQEQEARGGFAFCSMGETKECFTEGGEFKASLLEGERFGERFSRSRPKVKSTWG